MRGKMISLPCAKVSIGLFVFNGEKTLRQTVDGLLGQTMDDFELIISDNCSSDATGEICLDYANRDVRVKYLRQSENIGIYANLAVVLEQASGQYFMWSACDDLRSPDFLEHNLAFLEANPHYVASSSPNGMETADGSPPEMSLFSIEGPVDIRFNIFLNNCWKSHGIFYALIRTNVLKRCDVIGEDFLGADWAIDLFVVRSGPINRSKFGFMVSGSRGVSSGINAWRAFHKHPIEWLLPFFFFSSYAIKLSSDFKMPTRIILATRLLALNFKAAGNKIFSFSYQFYRYNLRRRLTITRLL